MLSPAFLEPTTLNQMELTKQGQGEKAGEICLDVFHTLKLQEILNPIPILTFTILGLDASIVKKKKNVLA